MYWKTVDFTTVLSRKLIDAEMKDVLSLHKRIESLSPKKVLNAGLIALYISLFDLEKLPVVYNMTFGHNEPLICCLMEL